MLQHQKLRKEAPWSGCGLGSAPSEPVSAVPRTGAVGATTFQGMHQAEVPAQALLISAELTLPRIRLSNHLTAGWNGICCGKRGSCRPLIINNHSIIESTQLIADPLL